MNINKEFELEQIAVEIGNFCAKWGRIHISQTKEKYGTCRVYIYFGFYGLHGTLFPKNNYKHKYFPQWLWQLDNYVFYKLTTKLTSLLDFVVIPWQQYIYKLAYKRAIKKYSYYEEAITTCMDYPELLI